MAVVIRRGPSKQTTVLGWDRRTDEFEIGQWLKGRIYHYRCDISPDGKHWIYFAIKGETWTVVAETPWLKALDFYPKGDAWEWADVDGKRLVWAEKGFIRCAKMKGKVLGEPRDLFDCNALTFERLKAPY